MSGASEQTGIGSICGLEVCFDEHTYACTAAAFLRGPDETTPLAAEQVGVLGYLGAARFPFDPRLGKHTKGFGNLDFRVRKLLFGQNST
jgi:hypothetical protein